MYGNWPPQNVGCYYAVSDYADSRQKGPAGTVVKDFERYIRGINDPNLKVPSLCNYCPALEQPNGNTLKEIDASFLTQLRSNSAPRTAEKNVIEYLNAIGVKGAPETKIFATRWWHQDIWFNRQGKGINRHGEYTKHILEKKLSILGVKTKQKRKRTKR